MVVRLNRVMSWDVVDKRQWQSSDGKLRVVLLGMKGDSNRYATYAASKYVGSFNSLEEAQKAAEDYYYNVEQS